MTAAKAFAAFCEAFAVVTNQGSTKLEVTIDGEASDHRVFAPGAGGHTLTAREL